MTDQVNEQEAQQLAMVRQSILASVFQQYEALTKMIRALPIPNQIPGIFKGLSYLEDGMLWVKEVLLVCPIQFPEPEKKDNEVAPTGNEISPPESQEELTAA